MTYYCGGMNNTETTPISEPAKAFKPGIYRHYKGNLYRAFFVGRLSEDREKEMVVYYSLERKTYWIRPLAMFTENVEIEGKTLPRFEWVKSDNQILPD
jgi:hypothetical protein